MNTRTEPISRQSLATDRTPGAQAGQSHRAVRQYAFETVVRYTWSCADDAHDRDEYHETRRRRTDAAPTRVLGVAS